LANQEVEQMIAIDEVEVFEPKRPFRIGTPTPQPSQGAKPAIVIFNIRCPICHDWWIFEFLTTITKMSDIQGAQKGILDEKSVWRLDTSFWGRDALCGICSAKERAFMPDGTSLHQIPSRVWTESDEKAMWGRLKHQQGEYAAVLAVRPPDGEPLKDQQRDVREAIIPKGTIVITRERCKNLNLGWGQVG
jgi:hypothetical protein